MRNLEGMTGKGHRLTAIMLCVVMLCGMLVPMPMSAAAQDGQAIPEMERVADASTIENWKLLFAEEEDTFNAGRIWTDKTVVDGDITVNETEKVVQRKGQDNFLVGLSALSSTQEVTMTAAKPVDLMLVLDISGTMMDGIIGGTKISLLVKQVNKLMTTIQKLNPENRVGIVCFSGTTVGGESSVDSAFCLLPMDQYTTESGDYLWVDESRTISRYYRIGIDQTVRNSSGSQMNSEGINHGYIVNGNTYMQNGWLEALECLTSSMQSPENKEERIPIITLMTDGAPTAGSAKYAERGDSTFTMLDGIDIRMSFVNQLTGAWVKKVLAESYQMTPLFYTFGIEYLVDGVELGYMQEILNPSMNRNPEIEGWWTQFFEAETGIPIRLQSTTGKSLQVIKVDDRLREIEDSHYVDEYFAVTKGSELEECFKQLVELIKIQTAELPTEEGENGTLKFEDTIGEYMHVEHINGMMCEGVLNSGSTFAAKLALNGNVTPEENVEVFNALQERLGITGEQAKELLVNAQETGQIAYTSEEEFSNCIAWYADGSGVYMAPYREDETAPEGASFLNRSYFYYGMPTGTLTGGEMLKLGVRIEENLAIQEQKVKFSIPRSLLPLVRYDVMTSAENIEDSTTTKTEEMPIHLFYEVGMKEEVKGYGILQVDSEYPYVERTDLAKTSTFYANRWELQGEIAEAKAMVHFDVSDKNDYYFYTRETPVYYKTPDNTFERYTGKKPQANDGNEYYYQKRVYNVEKGGQILNLPIEEASFDHVSQAENGEWMVAAGTFRYENLQKEAKNDAGNKTGTASYVNKPILESENGSVKVFLGNNGKLVQKQGKIVVSKYVTGGFADGHDANTEFEFELDLKPIEGERIPVSIQGEKQGQKIECPVEKEKIKFTLKAEEKIEFWLPEGKSVSVEEVGENAKLYTNIITVTKAGETDEQKEERVKKDIEIETQKKTLVVVENKTPFRVLGLEKLDEKGNQLGGATFQLYRLECIDPENHTDADHKLPIQKENEQKCWKFLSEATSDRWWGELVFDTGDGDKNVFKKGVYRFVEIEAPKGYTVPKGQWNLYMFPEVNIRWRIEPVLGPNGEMPPATVKIDEGTIGFYNYKPLDPPITGGRGTWYYFLFGSFAVLGGAGLVIRQIRRRKHGNS